MMKLFTKTLCHQDDSYIVAWSKGLKNKGFVSVEGITSKDPEVVAEISTIKYLLFNENIFNREITTGKGFQLICDPLIHKIHNGKTSRKHLEHFLFFLNHNFAGCLVTKMNRNHEELLPQLDDEDLPVITIEDSGSIQDNDIIETPAIGRIRITSHALEQYKQRLHSGEAERPRRSLLKRLRHPEIRQKKLPDNVEIKKIRKYGTMENTEIWGHDSSQMHFVVVRDPSNQLGTLVTVYKRHPDYQ